MKRRSFLGRLARGVTGGGLLLGAGAASGVPLAGGRSPRPGDGAASPGAARRDALSSIGLQLYTVRTRMADDVPATLEAVAEIGYREVEFAGYFEHPAERIRDLLEETGLAAPSAHVELPAEPEALERLVEFARTAGHRQLVLPWIPPEARETLDGYRRLCDDLNRAGEIVGAAGLRLAYHNHDFEFAALEGRVPYDLMLERCDPTLVDFQLDLYWIVRGGGDPIRYLQGHRGRFPSCHVKDMAPDGSMVEVGAGQIDFPAIFRQASAVDLKHYFVEHDGPSDPLASVRASYEYLENL